MPSRGSRAGEYWTRDHIDTADTLKFIHIQKQAGVVPDIEEFLRTPIGRQLVQKWGDGTKGTKKVKYNFRLTLSRYEEWRNTGGGAGALVALFPFWCFPISSANQTSFSQETSPLNSCLGQVFLSLREIADDKAA